MTSIGLRAESAVARARRVADVAARFADEVDRDARFPHEAVDALRAEDLLASLVPASLGGEDASLGDIAEATTVLGRACASTAMVFAMHQIQVACLVRHGGTPAIDAYLRNLATDGHLLASATSEVGIGGDVRSSSCAVVRAGDRVHLQKEASVISYGAFADAILTTARRTPDSPPSDQVLVLCRKPHVSLEQRTGWDTLGFRGTCSNGFLLVADDDAAYVLPDSYGDISSQTMLPTSHVVWASVWLGIASAAADTARRYVQQAARKNPGTTPPSAMRLAELTARHQQFVELVRGATRRYEETWADDDRDAVASVSFAVTMNALKVSASELVVDLVQRALLICGMAGYANDSPMSLGRLLRDAHGAALMVNNDRINANNAQLLLMQRES
jgi:acyl-CoA dehydrogenase